jgi:hypothetical protein
MPRMERERGQRFSRSESLQIRAHPLHRHPRCAWNGRILTKWLTFAHRDLRDRRSLETSIVMHCDRAAGLIFG